MIVSFVVCLLFSFVCGNAIRDNPLKLVIDHDGGSDDAMGIFIGLLTEGHLGGPAVVAITTVNGNVKEEQVFINTRKILVIANRTDVPVYRGCNSSMVLTYPGDTYFGVDGLGDLGNDNFAATPAEPEPAAVALVRLAKEYQGQLVIVCLGPLTNIAVALKLDPFFISRLKQLYIASGTIQSDKYPDIQFNVMIDTEAYYTVLESSTPDLVTEIPSSNNKDYLNISMSWREMVLGSIDTNIMKAQNEFERVSSNASHVWHLLDPAVMSMALNGELVAQSLYEEPIVTEYVFSNSSVILYGKQRGYCTNNITEREKSNIRLTYVMDVNVYKRFLFDVFQTY